MHILIRHAEQSTITVSALHPLDWRVTEGRIARINGENRAKGGVSISGDAIAVFGSNTVAVSASWGSVVNVSGMNNIAVQAGYGSTVHIDARPAQPTAVLELTDTIEIVVPMGFSVPLDLILGNAKVEIDTWRRDQLNVLSSGTVNATLAGLPLK